MTDAPAGEALIEQEVAAVAPVLDDAPGEVTPPDPADVDADAPAEPVLEAAVELDAAPASVDAPAGPGEVETEVVESFDPRISIPETLE